MKRYNQIIATGLTAAALVGCSGESDYSGAYFATIGDSCAPLTKSDIRSNDILLSTDTPFITIQKNEESQEGDYVATSTTIHGAKALYTSFPFSFTGKEAVIMFPELENDQDAFMALLELSHYGKNRILIKDYSTSYLPFPEPGKRNNILKQHDFQSSAISDISGSKGLCLTKQPK